MAKFQFRDRIPINVPHTLMQLLSRFQGVRDGLPELIKNSKDQYSRLGLTEKGVRTIVVVANTAERSIAVIDFAGATADQFKRWEVWSDPAANAKDRAADIEGGHGNGGKAFMVLGSTSDSSFESCFDGHRTRMGYENETDSARFRPGIALENGKPIENQQIDSARNQFNRSLNELGIKFNQLPKAARDTFESRQAFTIAQVNGVKDWTNARAETVRRSAYELRQTIETHPQAALTVESCSVWFVIDGQVIGDEPASARYPEPFPGFTEPLTIRVPETLRDPQTGEKVSTGPADESKALTLRTSGKSLRTEDMRPLHLIRVRNARNVVGLWSVAALCPGASSGFVFGELRVPALDEEHAHRPNPCELKDTPLARATEEWTAEQVVEFSDRIQRAIGYSKEDREKVNHRLAQMRGVMASFLGKSGRRRPRRRAQL